MYNYDEYFKRKKIEFQKFIRNKKILFSKSNNNVDDKSPTEINDETPPVVNNDENPPVVNKVEPVVNKEESPISDKPPIDFEIKGNIGDDEKKKIVLTYLKYDKMEINEPDISNDFIKKTLTNCYTLTENGKKVIKNKINSKKEDDKEKSTGGKKKKTCRKRNNKRTTRRYKK